MNAAAERLEFAPPATPGLLRALLLALLAHGLLVAALTWGVQWRREAQQLSAEAELWAAIPQETAPPAPPPEPPPAQAAPEPVPQPPALQPVVEAPKVDVALEREKQRLQKHKQLELERQQEKLKQEKLRQEQLKADKLKAEKLKQTQADKAKAAQEKKKAEQDAKRVEALRQQNLQRLAGLAGASGNANATGNALKSAGPSASYAGRIRARIKPNIVFTEELAGNPTTEVEVRTAPDGTIVGRKVTKTSGAKEWDEAVLKAIDKTQILPRDVDGSMPSSLLLVFRPKD